MELVMVVEIKGEQKRIGWISLQPDGSVSVGLNDRTFVSPDFKAQNFVWNLYNRVTLHYLVESNPATLKPITNPHLTYHPPINFHLRANGEDLLFEGIADLNLMLQQDGIVPWVRFVSKPVSKMSVAKSSWKPDRTRFLVTKLERDDCSIGIGVDFVRSDIILNSKELIFSEEISWQDYKLHVHSSLLQPQIATLSWFHQK